MFTRHLLTETLNWFILLPSSRLKTLMVMLCCCFLFSAGASQQFGIDSEKKREEPWSQTTKPEEQKFVKKRKSNRRNNEDGEKKDPDSPDYGWAKQTCKHTGGVLWFPKSLLHFKVISAFFRGQTYDLFMTILTQRTSGFNASGCNPQLQTNPTKGNTTWNDAEVSFICAVLWIQYCMKDKTKRKNI